MPPLLITREDFDLLVCAGHDELASGIEYAPAAALAHLNNWNFALLEVADLVKDTLGELL